MTEAADPNGNRVYYQYDKIGRVTKETYPFNSHTNQTPTKEIAYEDGYNRMVVKDENGYRTRYEYNGLGELTAVVDADSGVVYEGITYDNRGRRKTETAYHTGHATVTSYGYDVFDRVTGKTVSGRQAGNSSGILYQETTTYDDVLDGKWNRQTVTVLGDDPAPLGELANGHGAQAVTTVTYTNALGQVVRQGVLADGKEYCGISAYDKAGNRVSAHDARGHRTTWEYNYAGQVVKETDPAGHFSRTEYDALGNAVRMWDKMHSSESDVSVLSEYDALGRLVEQQTPHIYGLPIPGPWVQYAINNTVRYGYDAAGNVTEMAIPEVRKTAYTYDNRNRLRDTIQYEGDGREARTRQEYDNAGNPAAVWTGMQGESTEGARKTGYAYNRFGQAVRVTDPMGGVERYGYDAYGRLTERTDRKGNRTGYGYDGLGRETERTVWGADGSIVSFTTGYTRTGQVLCQGGGTAGRPLYYGYDGFGNLVRATEYVMRYNQFMAGSWREYGYDAVGNRTAFVLHTGGSRQETSYEYDKCDRLTRVRADGAAVAAYRYDANGRRTSLEHANGVVEAWSYHPSNQVEQQTATHANGTPLKYYHYDAFGVEEDPEPMDANPFRYCGEYWDAETATLYLRARHYDPKTGRFTQEDVARDGNNWYAYCDGNPVAFVDPSGCEAVTAIFIFLLLAFGVSSIAATDPNILSPSVPSSNFSLPGLSLPNIASPNLRSDWDDGTAARPIPQGEVYQFPGNPPSDKKSPDQKPKPIVPPLPQAQSRSDEEAEGKYYLATVGPKGSLIMTGKGGMINGDMFTEEELILALYTQDAAGIYRPNDSWGYYSEDYNDARRAVHIVKKEETEGGMRSGKAVPGTTATGIFIPRLITHHGGLMEGAESSIFIFTDGMESLQKTKESKKGNRRNWL